MIRYVDRQQMSWRAVDVERWIAEDHMARAIWELVGHLNQLSFYRAIAERGGRRAASGRTAPQRLPPSAFIFQPETNRYVCPEGKFLHHEERLKNERGLLSRRYLARAKDCQACLRKPECCPENRRGGRGILRLEESAAILAFRQKLATQQARANYHRRGRVAEFCNAWIKSKLGLTQFHVRGLAKVQMEMLWALPHFTTSSSGSDCEKLIPWLL